MAYLTKRNIGIMVVALAIGALTWIATNSRANGLPTVRAERRTIVQTIEISGTTKARENVTLGFERGGTIRSVEASVGKRVSAGALLATLDQNDLAAELAEAEADSKLQNAKLAELRAGMRAEELAVYEARVERAADELNDAKTTLSLTLTDSFTQADDALHRVADQLFNNPRSKQPTLTSSISIDQQLRIDLEWNRLLIEPIISAWREREISKADLNRLDSDIDSAKTALRALGTFLDMLTRAVNSATPSAALTTQTLAEWRSSLAGSRTNVRGAIVSLSTAESRANDATHNLKIAERELALARAGATTEQLTAQESLVAASRARTNRIRAQLAKTILRSPISGIVTVQNAHVGEIASAGTPIITVMELGALKIEANVPEITIGEVTVDDPITATFDAFPSERFTGTVAAIDPAATIVDGVVNYRVTVFLDNHDERLRSGLTANLLINAVTRKNTLALPSSAITESSLGTFVRRISSSGISNIPVTIGLRGSDGLVEITSGLAEFDTVIKTANYHESK